MIHLKRAYETAEPTDGTRFLVERLWPRGVKKTSLKLDGWIKEVAPSTELRKWFNHDPAKWKEFQHRYFDELKSNPEPWHKILEAAHHGTVTLVYSSHDSEHNNAVALRDFLAAHVKKSG